MGTYCSYRNALGKPNQGFHTHIGGVALGDILGTLVVAWIIVRFTHWDFSLVAAILFFMAYGLHRMFCIKTKVN